MGGGDIGSVSLDGCGSPMHMSGQEIGEAITRKWPIAREGLIERNAEGVEIGAGPQDAQHDTLRRHIGGVTDHLTGHGDRGRVIVNISEVLGDSETR